MRGKNIQPGTRTSLIHLAYPSRALPSPTPLRPGVAASLPGHLFCIGVNKRQLGSTNKENVKYLNKVAELEEVSISSVEVMALPLPRPVLKDASKVVVVDNAA